MTRARIALAAAGIVMALAGQAGAAPSAGEAAPALVAPEIGGGTFDLAALRGKVVIVNFWATWCPPCREEMPALDAFYARFHGQGVELVGISADRSRDRDAVVKTAQTVHYKLALLGEAETNGFGKPAELPVTYVIDPAGTVRAVLTPEAAAITEAVLEKIVAPLLPAGKP